jgi:hypothetical protein
MYIDLGLKQRRAKNIIITGMQCSRDDRRAVSDLLQKEFRLDDDPVVSCKRIGRSSGDRVQPLLVNMQSRSDAEYIIHNAKFLRKSRNAEVRQNIFISADLTPAESKAAYELRCRRRERREHSMQLAADVPDQTSTDGGRIFYGSRPSKNASDNCTTATSASAVSASITTGRH